MITFLCSFNTSPPVSHSAPKITNDATHLWKGWSATFILLPDLDKQTYYLDSYSDFLDTKIVSLGSWANSQDQDTKWSKTGITVETDN